MVSESYYLYSVRDDYLASLYWVRLEWTFHWLIRR